MGYVTLTTHLSDVFFDLRLGLAVVYLSTKYEVSSSTHRQGMQNIETGVVWILRVTQGHLK